MTESDLPCQDKMAFITKDEAEGAAVMAQHRYGGIKPSVYKCKYCEEWHLSTGIEIEIEED